MRGIAAALVLIRPAVHCQEVIGVVGESPSLLVRPLRCPGGPGIRQRHHVIDLDFSRFLPRDEFDRLTRVGVLKRTFLDDAQPPIPKSHPGQVPGQNVIPCVATVVVLVRPRPPEGFSVVRVPDLIVFHGERGQISGRVLRENDASRPALGPGVDPLPEPLSSTAIENPQAKQHQDGQSDDRGPDRDPENLTGRLHIFRPHGQKDSTVPGSRPSARVDKPVPVSQKAQIGNS